MKINELLKKRPTLSFEIFPPKNNENDITSIYATIDELAKMNPDFISVTYGANGSTSKNTCKIASTIKNKYGIESVAHLTCMNNTKDEIKEILEELKENGIESLVKGMLTFAKGEERDLYLGVIERGLLEIGALLKEYNVI